LLVIVVGSLSLYSNDWSESKLSNEEECSCYWSGFLDNSALLSMDGFVLVWFRFVNRNGTLLEPLNEMGIENSFQQTDGQHS